MNETVTYRDLGGRVVEAELLGPAPLVHGGFSSPVYVFNEHGGFSVAAKRRGGLWVEWARLAPWEGVGREPTRYYWQAPKPVMPMAWCRVCGAVLARRDRLDPVPTVRPVGLACGGEAGCPPPGVAR